MLGWNPSLIIKIISHLSEPSQKYMTSFLKPSKLANDHAFRSSYICKLVQELDNSSAVDQPRKGTIPKLIIQYWHDPEDLPVDVLNCLKSWSTLESIGFTKMLFNDELASKYISAHFGDRYVQAFDRCHHPAMRCDYFRLCFILLNGGFYVDADEKYSGRQFDDYFRDSRLKVQPLCYDITTNTMVEPQFFLSERKSSASWIFYINNNPLISPPNHPVIHIALNRANRLLLADTGKADIQSTTGPGNITASLVEYALSCEHANEPKNFQILPDWKEISTSVWPLSYRSDDRNWRLANLGE